MAIAAIVLLVEPRPRASRRRWSGPRRAATGIGWYAPARDSAGRRRSRSGRPRVDRGRAPARRPPRSSAKARAASAGLISPSSPISVRTKSWRHSAISMPSAEKFPGSLGMTTRGIEISRAIATACSGPAPPKAMSVVSRGSMPRSTETARTASDIAPSAMVAMPSAASTGPSASGSPIAPHRLLGRCAIKRHVPPRKRAPLSRPSTRSASVTAGASPPRP